MDTKEGQGQTHLFSSSSPVFPLERRQKRGRPKWRVKRSCKTEGWRGTERRRDPRRLLEAQRDRGKREREREKKRSLVLVHSPPSPALPTQRRKNPPPGVGGQNPATPAMSWSPCHRGGLKPIPTDLLDIHHDQGLTWNSKPILHQPPVLPAGIPILKASGASRIPQDSTSSPEDSREVTATSQPPQRHSGFSRLQFPKLLC